ncbi:MAG: hypothetical protein IKV41_07490 [Oscillospiraceae bacterium]|nr:hypothetical protein [Oscillospiraceae bacterium]
MKKSVYSLVLADDVVRAIDNMAYSMNTSRSNLINQILAQAVSYTTPEQRMKDIFTSLIRVFEPQTALQVQEQPSDSMISLRSAIRFKYNPTIRYSVELYRTGGDAVGELKIATRTQSRQLMALLEEFFEGIVLLEKNTLKKSAYRFSGGKFHREILLENSNRLSHEQLGEAIAAYIQMLDNAMKAYFNNINDMQTASKHITEIYSNYINENKILI